MEVIGLGEQLDLTKYSVRTDLALEASAMAVEERNKTLKEEEQPVSEIEGVIIKERQEDGITISTVEITDEGAEAVGKKKGNYLTLEVQGIRQKDSELQQKVQEVFAKEFSQFLSNLNIGK